MTGTYTLYGMDISLYSGKARAYLRYKGVPLREVFPTLNVYRKFIIPRTGVRYVPVLHTPDDLVVQDTTAIIDHVEARHPTPAVYPDDPVQRLVALLLELYGDEWLLIPAMHYRWSYIADNGAELFPEWGRIVAPWAPRLLRHWLGQRLSRRFAGMLPMLGVHPHSLEAVEASYLAVLDDLNTHFTAHPYTLGGRPSLGDYGLIAPLYAHLGRDTHPRQLMQDRAPAVFDWVQRTHAGAPATGGWLPEGQIPDTLAPVLARQFTEQVPVLLDTADRLAAWAQRRDAGARVSRMIGTHTVTIEGVDCERAVIPYSLWMWQRAVDQYAALNDADRARADAVLPDGGAALRVPLPQRVARVENQLVLA